MNLQDLYKDIGSSYGTGKYSNLYSLDSLNNVFNPINNNTIDNNILNTNTNNINNNNSNNTILDSTTSPVVSQQQFDWNSYLGTLSSSQKEAQAKAAQDALTENYLVQRIKSKTTGEQSVIPQTQQEFMDLYGKTPEGGWTDQNTYTGKHDTALQGWLTDPSLLPKMNLYGSGSQEDIQKGFNVLQHYAPRNINEFWSLSPDVQKAMLEHPDAALTFMQKAANAANEDWLSIGAEGGFSDPTAYLTQNGQFGVDPKKYVQINDGGLLHSVFKFADPILDKVDPLHNPIQNLITDGLGFQNQEQAFSTIAPMVLNAFLPGAGSAVTAADAASRGDMTGAIIGGAGAAMGMSGYPGLTGNPLYDKMITQATTSGLSTANRGGSLGDIFRDAALSGLSSYAGGNTGLSDLTGLSQQVSNLLTSGGMNILNQMVRQGEIDPAQLAIALGKAGLQNYMKG